MCVCSSSERHCAHKSLAKWFVYQVESFLLSDINEQGDLEDGFPMIILMKNLNQLKVDCANFTAA